MFTNKSGTPNHPSLFSNVTPPPLPPRDNFLGRTVQQTTSLIKNPPPFNPEIDAHFSTLMVKPSAPPAEEYVSHKAHLIGKEGLSSSDTSITPPSGSPPKETIVTKIKQSESRISPIIAKLANAVKQSYEQFDASLPFAAPDLLKETTFIGDKLNMTSAGMNTFVNDLLMSTHSINSLDLTCFGENAPDLTDLFTNLKFTRITQLTLGRILTDNEAVALVGAIKDNNKLNVEPIFFENFYAIIPKIRDMGFGDLALSYCDKALPKFSENPEQKSKILFQIGKANRKLGKLDKAEEFLLQAYTIDNKYYSILNELFIVSRHQYKEFRNKANESDELNATSRILVHKAFAANDKAIIWAEKALDSSDGKTILDALWNLTTACIDDHSGNRLTRLEFAATCLENILKLDPNDTEAIRTYNSLKKALK